MYGLKTTWLSPHTVIIIGGRIISNRKQRSDKKISKEQFQIISFRIFNINDAIINKQYPIN